jgi:hypothetical protein
MAISKKSSFKNAGKLDKFSDVLLGIFIYQNPEQALTYLMCFFAKKRSAA